MANEDVVLTLRFNTRAAKAEVQKFANEAKRSLQRIASTPGRDPFTGAVQPLRGSGLPGVSDIGGKGVAGGGIKGSSLAGLGGLDQKLLDAKEKEWQEVLRSIRERMRVNQAIKESAVIEKRIADERMRNSIREQAVVNQRIRDSFLIRTERFGAFKGHTGGAKAAELAAERIEGIAGSEREAVTRRNREEARRQAEQYRARRAFEEGPLARATEQTKAERTEANRQRGIDALNERKQRANKEEIDTIRRSVHERKRVNAALQETRRIQSNQRLRGLGLAGVGADGVEGPANALGISKTATGLLALSSVLAPLNGQLGMIAMQAGFAAFSLGPAVAAMSLFSSGLAGFIALLKKGVSLAKDANLQTVGWTRATAGFSVEVQTFLKVLGIKTQEAFEPVVEKLTEVFRKLEDLPWDDFIDQAASAAGALTDLAGILASIGGLAPREPLQNMMDLLNETKGLKGRQRIRYNIPDAIFDIFRGMNNTVKNMDKILATGDKRERRRLILENTKFAKELAEVKGPPGDPQFEYVPKFEFRDVDAVGRSIQKSIFREAEKPFEQRMHDIAEKSLRNLREINAKTPGEATREATEGLN